VIDSHQHFWKYNAGEFPWISKDSLLCRDFLPAQLEQTISGTGITAVVAVQARPSLEETEWLLSLAAQNSWIRGIVGWVPLKDPSVGAVLDRFTNNSHFRGVREMIQGAPDDRFFANADFQRGIRELTKRKIAYDLLISSHQLTAASQFVATHPKQKFILDHIAKPEIGSTFPDDWARGMRELAAQENVFCKFSGVVTEVRDGKWSVERIRPYFETVLEAFGPTRLMFGSDWPVCLLRTDYAHWVSAVKELVRHLSVREREAIFCETAKTAYDLKK
jgi:L-fuconolactonase